MFIGDRNLFIGDNLDFLQQLPDNLVDLIVADPPFKSNVVYTRRDPESGVVYSFDDRWVSAGADANVDKPVLNTLVDLLCEHNKSMSAYLSYLIPRLIEIYRVLSKTGSLYLMCDDHSVHYIKIVLDSIFGPNSFRNDLIRRRNYHSTKNIFGRSHDNILFYSKSPSNYKFNLVNSGNLDFPYTENLTGRKYRIQRLTGAGGRHDLASSCVWRGYDPMLARRHWAIPPRIIDLYSSDPELSTGDKLDLLDLNQRLVYAKKADALPRIKIYQDDPPSGYGCVPDLLLDFMRLRADEKHVYPLKNR